MVEVKTETFSECAVCHQPFMDNDVVVDTVLNAPVHKKCKTAPIGELEALEDQLFKTRSVKVEPEIQRNSITPQPEEPQEPAMPFQAVYQWATELTNEQERDNANYLWTPQAESLLNRLRYTKNGLIAVVGLQGTGKTALMSALWSKLKNAHGIKWFGQKNTEDILKEFSNIDAHLLISELCLHFETAQLREMILRQPEEVRYSLHRLIIKGDDFGEDSRSYIPFLIDMLGKDRFDKLQRETVHYDVCRANILIDMPDYDRNNRSQMIRDLTEIHKFWEDIAIRTQGDRECNLVLFMQKELFHGHFFYGKMDVIELEVVQPKWLVIHYLRRFGSTEPFDRDALNELAFLSRGIFRRFKKYIRICLDNYFQSNSITVETERKKERKVSLITLDNIQQWITLDQLTKDMELELSGLFPKQKELRNSSVILLRQLQKTTEIEQQILVKEIFGQEKASEMKGSRVLDKLEAYGYIKRELHGNNQKTVRLNS